MKLSKGSIEQDVQQFLMGRVPRKDGAGLGDGCQRLCEGQVGSVEKP